MKTFGGTDNCRILAGKLRHELEVFNQATTNVNKAIDPNLITSNVNVYDVIFNENPRISAIVKNDVQFLCNRGVKQEYLSELWKEYVVLGGNMHVVVYGIVEYVCTMYQYTSIESFLQKMIVDSAVRREILSHAT